MPHLYLTGVHTLLVCLAELVSDARWIFTHGKPARAAAIVTHFKAQPTDYTTQCRISAQTE